MSTPLIDFFVHGLPKPAGSKRAFIMPGKFGAKPRAIVTDANPNSKDWKHDVKMAALSSRQVPLWEGPLAVEFTFFMPRPQGHFGSGKNAGVLKATAPMRPITKPDVLKLSRGVEDALTGIIWKDDSQIVEEHLHKVYTGTSSTGVRIKIWKWGTVTDLSRVHVPMAVSTAESAEPAGHPESPIG